MKRSLIILCLLLSLLPARTFAQTADEAAGNLAAGGWVAQADDGAVYCALFDGIWRMEDGQKAERIWEGFANRLQFCDGKLYFVATEWSLDEDGYRRADADTIVCLTPESGDWKTVGEARRRGYEWNEDAQGVACDLYAGYMDLTIRDGRIYFIGNSELSGEYLCVWDMAGEEVERQEKTCRYESALALYSMNLDGSALTRLTEPLGNSCGGLSVGQDGIALFGGWRDANYAYDFVNYRIVDFDGRTLTDFHLPEEWRGEMPFFSQVGEFYHLPSNVRYLDDSSLWICLSESEGDFVQSRLMRLYADGSMETAAYLYQYVPPVIAEGKITYFGVDSQEVFWDDIDYAKSEGIYEKAPGEEGIGEMQVPLPDGDQPWWIRLGRIGDDVYVCKRMESEGWPTEPEEKAFDTARVYELSGVGE